MIKGNMVVGQSGGPTAAINASLAGVYCKAKELGVPKVYGMLGGVQGLLDKNFVDLDEYLNGDKTVDILKQTPSAALGSCRYKLPAIEGGEETYTKLFDVLKELDIAYFIYIGGNDSMDTIAKLSSYAEKTGSDIRFMGVPKTVDNDLAVTDHTPGFGSAAKYVATSVKEVICDSSVYDMKSITVIEIMGRNAGWLAASSVLAKGEDCVGVDLIYLPECGFDLEKCATKVEKLLSEKNTVVIAVSEALRDSDGNYIYGEGSVYAGLDSFGHKIMSGTGQFLARYLGGKLGVKARAIELNTLQRSAAHFASRQDIDESFMLGGASANAAAMGRTAEMSVIKRAADEPYQYKIETASIYEIANIEKTVPKEWICNDGSYVTEDFKRYCRPLIQGELKTVTRNGLPVHLKIK